MRKHTVLQVVLGFANELTEVQVMKPGNAYYVLLGVLLMTACQPDTDSARAGGTGNGGKEDRFEEGIPLGTFTRSSPCDGDSALDNHQALNQITLESTLRFSASFVWFDSDEEPRFVQESGAILPLPTVDDRPGKGVLALASEVVGGEPSARLRIYEFDYDQDVRELRLTANEQTAGESGVLYGELLNYGGEIMLSLGDRSSCAESGRVDGGVDLPPPDGSLPPDGTAPPVVLEPCSAGGATYHVAPTGNDSNQGTEPQPFRTLAKAVATAQAGDTVLVADGVYGEAVSFASSGSAGHCITLRAQSPCVRGATYKDQPVCSAVLDGADRTSDAIHLNRQQYIRIEGLEIRNYTGNGINCQARSEDLTSNVEFVNNYIHDILGNAIECRNVDDGLLAGNYIYNVRWGGYLQTTGNGIQIRGNGTTENVVIRDNIIVDTDIDGMKITGRNILVEGNILGSIHYSENRSHPDGIEIRPGVENLEIKNNTIFDFSQLIYIELGDDVNDIAHNYRIHGNVFYNDKYWTEDGGECPGIFLRSDRDDSDVDGIYIYSNTFAWVGAPPYGAIWVDGAGSGRFRNMQFRNNIFYESYIHVSENVDPTQVSSDYNLFFGELRPGFSARGYNEGSHSLDADPLFVDHERHRSFNFRLRSASPAIDTGENVDETTDLDGTARPQGGGFDLGAYESH